jgi:hypothetical protein
MGTRKAEALPARLEALQRRFERWRQVRTIPSRIPEPLWASAVRMASRYGVSRTAKMLRVNHYALKQRVDESAATTGETEQNADDEHRVSAGGVASVPAFLELASPMRAGLGQCTLELEDASGAKMRIELQGMETPDLAALCRSFWNSKP